MSKDSFINHSLNVLLVNVDSNNIIPWLLLIWNQFNYPWRWLRLFFFVVLSLPLIVLPQLPLQGLYFKSSHFLLLLQWSRICVPVLVCLCSSDCHQGRGLHFHRIIIIYTQQCGPWLVLVSSFIKRRLICNCSTRYLSLHHWLVLMMRVCIQRKRKHWAESGPLFVAFTKRLWYQETKGEGVGGDKDALHNLKLL